MPRGRGMDQPRWDQIPLDPPSVCGVLVAAEAQLFEGCCRETHVSSLTGSSKVPLRNHPEDFLQCWAAHCTPLAKGKHQAPSFRWSWGRAVFCTLHVPLAAQRLRMKMSPCLCLSVPLDVTEKLEGVALQVSSIHWKLQEFQCRQNVTLGYIGIYISVGEVYL